MVLTQGDVIKVTVSESVAAIPISVAFDDFFELLQYNEIVATTITIYME